jgi:FAD/FMN-containing dehydrogenase
LRWLPASTSIGAAIAGGRGQRSRSYGSVADHLLGLRFACPAVGLVKHGGAAIKNATGYNLSAIVAGSRGELGVILEATLRLVPVPPHRQVRILTFDKPECLRTAWNELTLAPLADACEVTVGDGSVGGKVVLEVEGIVERTVSDRMNRLIDLGVTKNGTVIPENPSVGLPNAGQTIYRSSFIRQETDAFLQGIARRALSKHFLVSTVIEGTGGGIEIVSDVTEPDSLRALARHLTLLRQSPDQSTVDRHLKAAFDPRNQMVSQPLLLHSYVGSP